MYCPGFVHVSLFVPVMFLLCSILSTFCLQPSYSAYVFRLRSVFVAFTFCLCSSYVSTMAQHTFRLLDTFHWLGVDRTILDISLGWQNLQEQNIGDPLNCGLPKHGNVPQGPILNINPPINIRIIPMHKFVTFWSFKWYQYADHYIWYVVIKWLNKFITLKTWESCIVGKKLVDTCKDFRRGPLEVRYRYRYWSKSCKKWAPTLHTCNDFRRGPKIEILGRF